VLVKTPFDNQLMRKFNIKGDNYKIKNPEDFMPFMTILQEKYPEGWPCLEIYLERYLELK
jgi:hypothetical protein